jgi:mRNA-degrading endonuclease RelE of RelBE toxin-antitoxin system
VSWEVVTTAHFDRSARKLYPPLEEARRILSADPYRGAGIRKLVDTDKYRLRVGRWRFIYSIDGRRVVLHDCALRREDTY